MKLRTCRNDAQKQVDKGNLGTDTPSVSKQPPNGGFFMPKIVQQKGGVDSLVRKGIKQVTSKGEANIGNIVVDMKKTKLSKQKSGAEVTRRLVRDNANKKIKVVLKYDDNNVISYKRKKGPFTQQRRGQGASLFIFIILKIFKKSTVQHKDFLA